MGFPPRRRRGGEGRGEGAAAVMTRCACGSSRFPVQRLLRFPLQYQALNGAPAPALRQAAPRAPPEPHRRLPVVLLIGDKRCYGESR